MQRTVTTIRVSRGPELTVVEVCSERPGPVVAVTANVHGDESTGVAAVHRLDQWLRTSIVAGRVLLFPSLNPAGLRAGTRELPGGSDLNRAFPGSDRGGPASRVAGVVWNFLRANEVGALIDLHADSSVSVPYVILDRSVRLPAEQRDSMDRQVARLAQASGLIALREYPDAEYLRFVLDQSLAGAMVNHAAVPAITIEAGPRRAVAADAVDTMVHAVQGVIGALGVCVGPAAAHPSFVEGGPWRRGSSPRSSLGGVFVPSIAPGNVFSKGDVLGEIRSLAGDLIEQVRAETNGIVISWMDGCWVEPRGVTGTLGLQE